MTEAREAVLARIRAALADVSRGEDVPVPRDYREHGSLDAGERLRLLVERVEDYGAAVVVTDDPTAAISAVLVGHGATRVVVTTDFPASLRPAGFDLVEDDGLAAAALDALDGALTTCALACAETGTIALDGGRGQGRRAITLVPDLHVCVVAEEQIVETMPELMARLEPSAREGRPIVLISGPSATSDIELSRVEGVHGPRRLAVVVAVGWASTLRVRGA